MLESPGSGELGGGESDGEGGSVEGDVEDEDGRVGGRTGGLWVAARPHVGPYSSLPPSVDLSAGHLS